MVETKPKMVRIFSIFIGVLKNDYFGHCKYKKSS